MACFKNSILCMIAVRTKRWVPNKSHWAAGLTWEVYWEEEIEAAFGRGRREGGLRENKTFTGPVVHEQRGMQQGLWHMCKERDRIQMKRRAEQSIYHDFCFLTTDTVSPSALALPLQLTHHDDYTCEPITGQSRQRQDLRIPRLPRHPGGRRKRSTVLGKYGGQEKGRA